MSSFVAASTIRERGGTAANDVAVASCGVSSTCAFALETAAVFNRSRDPTTIQLQTSGISFLQPQIEVYDQNFNLVGEAQSTSDFGDIVSVQLPRVNPLKHYYIEVNSASQDVFGTGRYALSITFNNRSIVNPASLPAILRGPYDSLGAGDIAGLLSGVGSLLVNSIVPNNTFVTATQLQSRAGYLANSSYSTDIRLMAA